MIGFAIPFLLVLLAVVLVVVVAMQRSMKKSDDKGSGADIVAYLVLALAMGVAGFALAELMNTAFPGDRFVFDPSQNLATSLAALVVSLPFLVFFWRRQADRRVRYPSSSGWTLYLSIIEMVFTTSLVITAVLFVNGLLGDDRASAWTGTLVFGSIVVFHEIAALRTPPLSDAGELRRVIGSAIGLVTGTIGLVGSLAAILGSWFDTLDLELDPWPAMLIVGGAVWAYRWLRPWSAASSVPRHAWLILVSVASLAVAIGSVTTLAILLAQYLLSDVVAGRSEAVPFALALLIAAVPVWVIHRRGLGTVRENPLRLYEYAMAGIGLAAGVSGAVGLTLVAFDRRLIVGGGTDEVIAFALTLVAGLVTWRLFDARHSRGDFEDEATAWPRRLYTLGLGVVFGLAAAGSLITTLFTLLRRLLDGEGDASVLTPSTIFVFTGLATWYLLAGYAKDRDVTDSDEIVTPFEVTIITSHPGSIATRFPKQARLQVVHRGDDAAPISDAMADEIVAAVDNKPSLVWVDQDGFRVAPKRVDR